jgi:hypothetical protein
MMGWAINRQKRYLLQASKHCSGVREVLALQVATQASIPLGACLSAKAAEHLNSAAFASIAAMFFRAASWA